MYDSTFPTRNARGRTVATLGGTNCCKGRHRCSNFRTPAVPTGCSRLPLGRWCASGMASPPQAGMLIRSPGCNTLFWRAAGREPVDVVRASASPISGTCPPSSAGVDLDPAQPRSGTTVFANTSCPAPASSWPRASSSATRSRRRPDPLHARIVDRSGFVSASSRHSGQDDTLNVAGTRGLPRREAGRRHDLNGWPAPAATSPMARPASTRSLWARETTPWTGGPTTRTSSTVAPAPTRSPTATAAARRPAWSSTADRERWRRRRQRRSAHAALQNFENIDG